MTDNPHGMGGELPYRDDDVAIIGIGLRFPGANRLAEFRDNLLAGVDSVGTVPTTRALRTGLDPDATRLPMAYLENIDGFDHAFFGMSRREAELVDPQQRLALLMAHEAIEDAGYGWDTIGSARTAVVFGTAVSDYLVGGSETGPLVGLGNLPFGLPSRIAHVLGLSGPCYALDTGCNGAMVAVHHACRELRSDEADYALCGGVHVLPAGAPAYTDDMAELVSPSGRCRAFDADADGLVGGEGGAVLLLATVRRALADRAPIHAVIRGTAILHNGPASATISAPSSTAQAAVVRRAWRAAGVDPGAAGYLETHGSGTPLGDAAEMEGIAAVYGGSANPIPIGSVKTNIGHLNHASGIAGLVKAVLSVRYGELYPSLHFVRPAAGADPSAAGARLVTETEQWKATDRLAGVNAFSLGGLNAHGVLQQPPDQGTGHEDPTRETETVGSAAPTGSTEPVMVGVSAASRPALIQLCADLGFALRADPTRRAPRLSDVARTLNLGRVHHRYRLAVHARDTEDLAWRLAAQATWLGGAREASGQDGRGTAVRRESVVPSVSLLLSPDGFPIPVPRSSGDDPTPEFPRTGPVAELLERQLAVHRELCRCGVPVCAVLGTGVSRYAARWIRGELTEQDIEELGRIRNTNADHSVDTDALGREVERLLAEGPALFVDPGVGGRLGPLVAELVGDRAWVYTVPDGGEGGRVNPFRDLLGELYRHGVDLDWQAVVPETNSARRLRLPGHPLADTSCWWSSPGSRAVPDAAGPPPTEPATTDAPAPVPDPAARRDREASNDFRQEHPVGPIGEDAVDPVVWLSETLVELLHVDAGISPEDDFFELGGNSLIALQLVQRIESSFGHRPKLIEIYERPRVDTLAELIGATAMDRPSGPTAGPPVTRQDEYTISFGQERMWFHHQIDPDTTIYHLPHTYLLRGPLDVAALRAAWEDLAERHETLRSNFVEVDGEPELRIRQSLGPFFTYVDLTAEPDPRSAARELTLAAARRPFDLAEDPLVRILVAKLGAEEHVEQGVLHHSVSDGGSVAIYERELPELYASRRDGRAPDLAPIQLRYRDYARWQRDLLASGGLEQELVYWKRTLADPPVLRMPTDHPRPGRISHRGSLADFVIEESLAVACRKLAAAESVTSFVVLLTAFYLLLWQRSGQHDLVVGTPTSGRSRPELHQLIGYFNSTVALRADLSGGPSLRDLLHRVRAVVAEAMDHQEVPFDRVVDALDARPGPSRSPLFDVFFINQEQAPGDGLPGVRTTTFEMEDSSTNAFAGIPTGTAKFDLTLITGIWNGHSAISAALEYSTDLFTEETIADLIGDYQDILRAMTSETARDAPASRLAERRSEPAASRSRDSLASNERPRLPADRPRPADPAYTHAAIGRAVDERLALAIGGPHGDDEGSRPVGLLAAWVVLLAWTSGQDRVAVAAPAADDLRRRVVVRADLSDEPTFRTLSARLTGAEPEASHPGDGLPVVFGLRTDPGSAGGRELGLRLVDEPTGGLRLVLDYAPEIFDRRTAERLGVELGRLLTGLAEDPDLGVYEVALRWLGEQVPQDGEPHTDPAELGWSEEVL